MISWTRLRDRVAIRAPAWKGNRRTRNRCGPRAEAEDFIYKPGRGVSARIGKDVVLVGNRLLLSDHDIAVPVALNGSSEGATSDVYVARDGRVLGVIALSDSVRSEAQKAIEAIHRMGMRTILLTGDAEPIAASVARQLAIKEAKRNCSRK
jgi:P-type Cu+ transporter